MRSHRSCLPTCKPQPSTGLAGSLRRCHYAPRPRYALGLCRRLSGASDSRLGYTAAGDQRSNVPRLCPEPVPPPGTNGHERAVKPQAAHRISDTPPGFPLLPKLTVRVRFSSPAPIAKSLVRGHVQPGFSMSADLFLVAAPRTFLASPGRHSRRPIITIDVVIVCRALGQRLIDARPRYPDPACESRAGKSRRVHRRLAQPMHQLPRAGTRIRRQLVAAGHAAAQQHRASCFSAEYIARNSHLTALCPAPPTPHRKPRKEMSCALGRGPIEQTDCLTPDFDELRQDRTVLRP